ncbi:hypothetical protein MMC29_003547 [Sticta canariensis]|nr:hypothetical protein [Sticta canariensis]
MPSYHLAFLFLAFNFFVSPICGDNDEDLSACSTVSAASSYCARATPGWSSQDFPEQAPCLCYDESAEWKPQIFDGVFSSCVNYLRAISVTSASQFPTAPCSAAGDVLASATDSAASVTDSASVGTPLITPAPAPSATSSALDNAIACSSLLGLESECENVSPGFSSFSSFQRAGCLCYFGDTWNPDFYDNIYGSCLDDISTRNTSLYSSLYADGITSTPCNDIGEITQDVDDKSAQTSRRPQTSVTSDVPAQTTRTRAEVSSTDTTGADSPVNRGTSSLTSTKGSSSGTGLPTQSANANGVGSGIELRAICLLAGLMSASLLAVLFL